MEGILGRWRERCRAQEGDGAAAWPEQDAGALLAAVLTALSGAGDEGLAPAARRWATATSSMPVLVRRLGTLRELLAESGVVEGPAATEHIQHVLDKVTTLSTEAALAELEDAALTDALTGVGNRRALDQAARAALATAVRRHEPLSVAVIDLDGLKAINDTSGHAAGDRAIAGMAASLRAALRDTDQVFRVGGDEFVALLPLAPGAMVAELMHRAERFNAPAFSWGAATAPADGTSLDELQRLADERLYEARREAGYYARDARPPVPTTTTGSATTRLPSRRGFATAAALSVAGVVGLALLWPAAPARPSPHTGATGAPPASTTTLPSGAPASLGRAVGTVPSPGAQPGTPAGPAAGAPGGGGATTTTLGRADGTTASAPPAPAGATTTTTAAAAGAPPGPAVTVPPPPVGTASVLSVP